MDSAGTLVLDALVGGGPRGGEREEAGGGAGGGAGDGAGDAEGGGAALLLLQREGPGCAVSAQRHHRVSEVLQHYHIIFTEATSILEFFANLDVL